MRRAGKKTRTKLYCGKAISKKRVSLDFALRLTVFGLVVLLAVMKFPDAKARMLSSSLFRLDAVTLKGNRYLMNPQIMSTAGIEEGACGLGLDVDEIRSRLLEHPRIRSATVKRFLWKKLYISVEERSPVALLENVRLLEIDDEGVVFEPVRPTLVPDLPVITGLSCGKLSPGDRVGGDEIERVLLLLRKLRDPEVNLYDQISEVHVDRHGALYLVSIHSGTPVLVGSETVTTKKLRALRVALADMQRREVKPGSLDLRFKNQIVVRGAEQSSADALADPGADAGRVALF
ncbi:MAG: FtsQ-type POTRA domain-containing protein [Candidatus Eiseniibacteriota bacterium]|nr:MAG: FtsQ-type POTRA domain-containing protein [Candidatus Eisenbacteria bacterium]